MFNFLISVLSLLFILCINLAISFSMVQRIKSKTVTIFLGLSLGVSFLSGIFLFVLHLMNAKKWLVFLTALNRRIIVASFLLVLLGFFSLLLWLFFSYREKVENKTKTLFFLTVSAILSSLSILSLNTYILPQLLAKMQDFVAFGEDSIGTETFFRISGYLLGIILALWLFISLYNLLKRLSSKYYQLLITVLYIIFLIELALRGIASAVRLRILSSNIDFIFNILIFEDKSLAYMIALYNAVILLIALVIFLKHCHLQESYRNTTLLRKDKWKNRNNKRWALMTVILFFISFLLVTLVYSYINKPVELVAAEEYIDSGRDIYIPLTQVEDGHLHRFSYSFEGRNIRFIVVRKPNSNSYGVGLDACEICGVAGYFERNNSVVCKRCDVVMNKATIGFKGGCNPIPFMYEVKDGQIHIEKSALEKEAERFPVGE